MLLSAKKKGIRTIVLTLLLFIGMLATPNVAHANYEYSWYSHSNGMPGETIGIGNGIGAHCPSGSMSDVEAVLTDSAQNEFVTTIATTNQIGDWVSGIMWISPYAASGQGSLVLRCRDVFSLLSYPYVSIPFLVHTLDSQPTRIEVDRVQFNMNSTFNSVPGQGCAPYEGVSIKLYGTEQNDFTDRTKAATGVLAEVVGTANIAGDWSLQVYIDNAFKPNKTHYARVKCLGSSYEYPSFAIIPYWNYYVAVGDSYSSGEGSYNYDLAGGRCHRSTDSYAHYLVSAEGFDLPDFQACSGAVTDDLPNANSPDNDVTMSQFTPLNSYTQNVTLTIGGNDIGFKSVAEACATYAGHSGYGCANSPLLADVDDRIAALNGVDTTPGDNQMIRTPYDGNWWSDREIHPITELLSTITMMAPNAKVYIAGYPKLFGDDTAYYDYDSNAPGSHTCTVTMGSGPTVKYSYADAQHLNLLTDQLNQVISDAVAAQNDPDIEYVDPFTFTGHGLCDAFQPYINGVDIVGISTTPESESLHPNVTGMEMGYGRSFSYVID